MITLVFLLVDGAVDPNAAATWQDVSHRPARGWSVRAPLGLTILPRWSIRSSALDRIAGARPVFALVQTLLRGRAPHRDLMAPPVQLPRQGR